MMNKDREIFSCCTYAYVHRCVISLICDGKFVNCYGHIPSELVRMFRNRNGNLSVHLNHLKFRTTVYLDVIKLSGSQV